MAASTKVLGPWAKGLNLTSNRDMSLYLDTDELGEATNVVYSPEGFVEPRPGFKKYVPILSGSFGTYDTLKILGTVDRGGTGQETVAVVQTLSGTQATIWLVRTSGEIVQAFVPPAGVSFNHLLTYKSPLSATHSGTFLFSNTLNKSYRDASGTMFGPFTVIDPNYAVPPSDTGIIIKDRLFLFDYANNKMWWSPANYVTDFNNYDKVNYGDDAFSEEPIEPFYQDPIKAVSYINNNIYIFKSNKTFMFTYQVDPAQDGYLRKINISLGALAATTFKESLIVVNSKGVFNVQGTDFIDIQKNLNLKNEIPTEPISSNSTIVLTSFHNNVLLTFKEPLPSTPPYKFNHYCYCWNSDNGAWSKWFFPYDNAIPLNSLIPMPHSKLYRIQEHPNPSRFVCVDVDQKNLLYMDYAPGPKLRAFHMDSLKTDTFATGVTKYFIPPVTIKTKASVGDSVLKFSKLYRTFLRFYLSDLPDAVLTDTSELWTISINYNDYSFNQDTRVDSNPRLVLHPSEEDFINNTQMENSNEGPYSAVYQRTYQIPIPQQRIKEFVFELKRNYSEVSPTLIATGPTDPGPGMVNPDADRAIKNGYYFRLSNIWFDYQSKGGI